MNPRRRKQQKRLAVEKRKEKIQIAEERDCSISLRAPCVDESEWPDPEIAGQYAMGDDPFENEVVAAEKDTQNSDSALILDEKLETDTEIQKKEIFKNFFHKKKKNR